MTSERHTGWFHISVLLKIGSEGKMVNKHYFINTNRMISLNAITA